MKQTYKFIASVSILVGALNATAAIPDGYYNSLEGKSGVSLKKAVKSVARTHQAIPYGDGTWEVFLESDTRMVGSQRCWWDMYSNDNVAAPNADSHGSLNIEHSVANSWWGGTKNDAYKDLMHLNPSNAEANNRKQNYPLGIVNNQTWGNGVTMVGKPASGSCGGAPYVYEPIDEYKGDFARAFFYMFTIYDDLQWKTSTGYGYMYDPGSDLLFKQWAYEMLLEWAKNDPVSQKEIDRNNAIYKHQKNRNPFIDCPELAEYIWGSKKNTPFHFGADIEPDDPDDPGKPDPDDPVTPEPDDPTVSSGFWYAVTSSSDLNETDSYILLSTDNNVAMSTTMGGNKYFQVCSVQPSFDSTVSPVRISSVPDDVAVIKLNKSESGWVLGIGDLSGNHLGYISSTSAKSLSLVSSLSANGTTAAITPKADETVISYGNAGELEYNVSSPRFLTYTSNQGNVMLYRLEEDTHNGDVETGIGTGLHETADETIRGIFTISGVKVAAESISELPRGIYIVVTNFGVKKILK